MPGRTDRGGCDSTPRGGPAGPLTLIHRNKSPNAGCIRPAGEDWMDVQQALEVVGGSLSPLAFVILRRAADGAT